MTDNKKYIDTGGGKLGIREFLFSLFKEHPSIVMVAKRGSGKSWIVKAILQHFKHIPVGLIISPTDLETSFYGNWFPESYIHYEYRSAILENLIARQKRMGKKAKDKKEDGKFVDPSCFVVMDDCLASKGKWINDPSIKVLFFNGRHYKIMYILTMQFPLGITPEMRQNIDYVFLLADDNVSNMKKLYEHYAGMFPSLSAFKLVFSHLTEEFCAMVIVNRGARAALTDKIYWYKAPNLENVNPEMGCRQFREFNEKNFDENWQDRGEDFIAENKKKSSYVTFSRKH